MQIQNHAHNTAFKCLKLEKIDVDHTRKYIEPVIQDLIELGKCCSLKIKETSIPIHIENDVVYGEPAINITAKPFWGNKLIFWVRKLFQKQPNKISVNIPIKELAQEKKPLLLVDTTEKAVSDLYSIGL